MNLDEMKKLLEKRNKGSEEGSGGGGGFEFINLPKEANIETKLRILVHKDAQLPGRIVGFHYNLPGDNKRHRCLAADAVSCPICKVVQEYNHLEDIVSPYRKSNKSYMNALKVDNATGKFENKVKILGGGEFNLFWLMENILNDDVGDITDPRTGSNVTFKRKKEGGAFDRIVGRKSYPISESEDELKQLVESCTNLEQVWKKPDDKMQESAKEAADLLKKHIEHRMTSMDSGTGAEADKAKDVENKHFGGETEGKKETFSKPAEESNNSSDDSKGQSPEGKSESSNEASGSSVDAPDESVADCYGKKHGEIDEMTCLTCVFEEDCKSAQGL